MGAILVVPALLAVLVPIIVVIATVAPVVLSIAVVLLTAVLPLIITIATISGGSGLTLVGLLAGLAKAKIPVALGRLIHEVQTRVHEASNGKCQTHEFVLDYPPSELNWSMIFDKRRRRRQVQVCGLCASRVVGGERSSTHGLGYFCSGCKIEICADCYLQQRSVQVPTRSLCLPYHTLFEQESLARSLQERGYALVELGHANREVFLSELDSYQQQSVNGCFQTVESTPLMRDMKQLCLDALPSSTPSAASVILSAVFAEDDRPDNNAGKAEERIIELPLIADDAAAPPPAMTLFLIDESSRISDGLRVVDKRFPQTWLSVSESLALPQMENKTFACIVLGEGIRLYSDDVRLRPCMVSMSDRSTSRGHVKIDVRVPIDEKRCRGRQSKWLCLADRVRGLVERNSAATTALKLASLSASIMVIVAIGSVVLDMKQQGEGSRWRGFWPNNSGRRGGGSARYL